MFCLILGNVILKSGASFSYLYNDMGVLTVIGTFFTISKYNKNLAIVKQVPLTFETLKIAPKGQNI
jgi:hypothetical protein